MDNFLKEVKENDITIFPYESIVFKDKLGRGATGTVYETLINDRRCAVKHIRSCHVETNYDYKKYLKDILYELKTCKIFDSKRLMKIYGISYDEDGDIYIVMELIKNKGSLYDYLYESAHVFTMEEKLRIFLSIIIAVRELHSKNYCHSDLKPENLCYYYDFKENKKYIKLIDFNCVTYVKKDKRKYISSIYGTYGYCSPEQHKYELALKSDIYSLGVILLELIYEDNIWDPDYYSYQRFRKSVVEHLNKLKDKENEIYSIIKKCLSTVPENRYSIDELYDVIKTYIKNGHIHRITHLD